MVEVKEKLKPIVNFMQIWTNVLAVKADKYTQRGDKLEGIAKATDDGFVIKMVVKRKISDKVEPFDLGTIKYKASPYGIGQSTIRLISGETDYTYYEEIINKSDADYADSNNISLLMKQANEGKNMADAYKDVFTLPILTKQTDEKPLYFLNRLDYDAILCAVSDRDFEKLLNEPDFKFVINIF